jgi:hypothetical protein
MGDDSRVKAGQRFSTAPRIIGLSILVVFVLALLVLVIAEWNSVDVREMVMRHFPAIVGLPAAGIFAFLIVSTFETTSGNIEFEALAIKFKGAAGPILMWVICYLAIVVSIHLLW